MDPLQVFILAVVQGLTEWLPISSSGHLVIAQQLMGLTLPVAFDVFLHLGTLVAVIIFFWRDIAKILRAFFTFDRASPDFNMALYIIIGTIPTAIIGLAFEGFFESLFSSAHDIGIAFIITGILLLATRIRGGVKKLSWLTSLIMGVMQGIAIAPGISRSGSTISIGLLSGVDKEQVFRYSFLLSIPAILGASLLKYNEIAVSDLGLLTIMGAMIAAVVGYLAIMFVRRVLLSKKFYLFSIYCFLAGLLVLLFLS
jgi:undecaprenyl-diphosphatase